MSAEEALCTSCGLCCDGAIFSHIALEPDEAEPLRRHGLRVLPDDATLALPCVGLVERKCTLYADRPVGCRRFACKLLREQMAQGDSPAPRLATIARTRLLAGRLRARLLETGAAPGRLWQHLFAAQQVRAAALAEPEVALDVAELVLRLRRDFGVGELREEQPDSKALNAERS